MKSVKKILSLILSLALIFGVMAVIPTTTVSAAAGDVFEVTGIPDSWKWYTSSYVTRESNGAQFGVKTNKGKGLDNYGILACNSQSADIIKANTTYKIEFDISSWYTLAKLQVDIDTGTALWSRTKSVTTFSDLASKASNISGNASSSKLSAHLTFVVTTPASISGNQHFVIGIIPKDSNTTSSAANLRFFNIKITELGTYTVVDENSNVLDTVTGLPGDDALTLVNASAANKDGVEIETVTPATIAADTTKIVVTYKKAEVKEIVVDFGETYGGSSESETWAYIEKSDNGTLKLQDGVVSTKTTANKGTTFGYRAVLLANSRSNSGLQAGSTYHVTLKLKTFPQWTPLSSLSAEMRFGGNIYNDHITDSTGADLSVPLDLASMVTDYTASSTGSVMFTLSTYITMPESGWASSTARNMLLSIYGGEWYLDEVTITLASEISVVDEDGNSLGTVAGIEGVKTETLIPDSLKPDSDYVYTASPEIVEDILTPIVLTKALKENIAEKILFNSDDYKGHGDTTTHYYSSKFYKDGGLKGVDIHKGATFGDRAVILANNRGEQNVVAGNTYRVKFQLRTTATQLSNYRIDVAFSDTSVWNTNNAIACTYSGTEIEPLIKSITTGNTYKYVIEIDVTVPENENLKNVCLSVCGIDAAVTYWLDNAYIIAQSEANISTYNEEYFATVKGFEGDAIGEAISTDGAAKFVNIEDAFGSKTVSVKSNSLIYRGDANADGLINATDLTLLRRYLLEVAKEDEYDTFGINASYGAEYGNDKAVDIRDLVRLSKIIVGYYDGPNLPETLTYNDYALAWNYEFDATSVDENVIGSTSGVHEIEGLNYVTVGDKNCVNVANGVLNISPKYNYGNMLASNPFSTQNTMNFAYGYFEIRAKLSYSAANLPAIWFKTDGGLSNKGDGDALEYDLLETFGNTSLFKHNVHYWDAEGNTYNANNTANREYAFESVAAAAQYHTYGFEWYYDEADACSYITLYVDGVKQGTLSANDINHRWYQDVPEDFDRPMYLILSNQIITQAYAEANSSWLAGRGATAEDFPMDMCVDYIRLYQSESNTGNVLVTK